MSPDRFHGQKKLSNRFVLTAVLLLISLLFLSSCFSLLQGSDSTDLSVSSPYTGTVEFQCNQTCADRGQCGQATDGTDFVFMSSIAPAVDQHDQLILPGARGNILDTITRTLQTTATSEQFPQPFHLVQIDGGLAGWVVEWCVAPVTN